MPEIKSAREIALEKVARLSQATEEERLRWRYVSDGEKLAIEYLNKGRDLVGELAGYEEKARKYVRDGAGTVLLASIGLPKNGPANSRNKRAMDGLMGLKNDKGAVVKVYNRIRHILNTYTGQGAEQRKQVYESLKLEWEARLKQAIEQRGGSTEGLEIGVEGLPQFQEEWRRKLVQLDSRYTELLDEYKHELEKIS
jgi:hypothetical protein